MTAFAYVNAGRLIADCPNLCGNAELIDETEAPRFNEFVCSYCGMRARIDRDPAAGGTNPRPGPAGILEK